MPTRNDDREWLSLGMVSLPVHLPMVPRRDVKPYGPLVIDHGTVGLLLQAKRIELFPQSSLCKFTRSALLFDEIPRYDPGHRILVNAVPQALGSSASTEVFSFLRDMLAKNSHSAYKTIISGHVLDFDVCNKLAQIRVPVLRSFHRTGA